MTQQPEGAAAPASDPADGVTLSRPGFVPAGVLAVGLLCAGAMVTWGHLLPARPTIPVPDGIWPFLLLVLAAMVGEIFYVPVRHGDTWEDQTFTEIVLVGGVLLFTPAEALVGTLLGLALSELLFQRVPIKAMFNIGAYAIASTAMIVVYYLIDAGGEPLGIRSVVALIVAMLVWEFTTLLLLGWILRLVEDVPLRELVRDQAWLSVLMALTAVGVATSAVALLSINVLLASFALLPAILLWFTFRANQAETKTRGSALLVAELPGVLTADTSAAARVAGAAGLVRDIFGADEVLVFLDQQTFRGSRNQPAALVGSADEPPFRHAVVSADPVVDLDESDLPPGWTRGAAVPIRSRDGAVGWFALGATAPPRGIEHVLPWSRGARDQWRLADEDRPGFANLVGSLASALRVGEETAKLTAVVDNASDGIAGFDARGRVVLWSPAMARITGIPEAAALNPTGPEPTITLLAGLRGEDSGADDVIVAVTRPDGEEREVEVAVERVAGDALTVLTVRDVTRQRRLERMKSDFIATAAHELRTPITPIKGYAQLLASERADRMTPEKRRKALAMIEERANHLSRLVDDLMLATRVSDSDKVFEVADIDTYDLADLVHRALAGKVDLEGRMTVTGTPVAVRCSETRATQCLDNLITNAVKYSPAGSPIAVEFGPAGDGRMGSVTVIDQGRGIPADEVDKVFGKFYRVEDPMTMTTGGQGLGLFLSREFARAMHGEITVESTFGRGSRFTLLLPLHQEVP